MERERGGGGGENENEHEHDGSQLYEHEVRGRRCPSCVVAGTLQAHTSDFLNWNVYWNKK